MTLFYKSLEDHMNLVLKDADGYEVLRVETRPDLAKNLYEFAWDTFAFELSVIYEIPEHEVGIEPEEYR